MRAPEFYTRAVFIDANGDAVEANSPFRMNFVIDKTFKRKPDSAELTIKNLHPSIRRKVGLTAVGLEVYCGTDKALLPLLFKGVVTDATVSRSSDHVDQDCTVYAEDTKSDLREKVIGRSFRAGLTVASVLSDLAIAGGVPLDIQTTTPKLNAPLPLLGAPAALLEETCTLYGLRYQIVSGVAIVTDTDAPLDVAQVPVVNSKTGLRGVPTSAVEGKRVKVTANTSLDANLAPGGRCIIETESTLGSRSAPIKPSAVYLIERVVFSSSDYQATITGRELGPD
jgi:hypothetical protein